MDNHEFISKRDFLMHLTQLRIDVLRRKHGLRVEPTTMDRRAKLTETAIQLRVWHDEVDKSPE